MMQDNCGRTIDYLRLSVTDNCNLRCRYCVPEGESTCAGENHLLTYDGYLRIVEAAVKLGVRKIRITGGEPLVRKGIAEFLSRLTAGPKIEDVSLTTNGILLEKFANSLHHAGVKRLNISLDSLHPYKFSEITRGGNLQRVLDGLEAVDQLGFKIKLNMVVMRGFNEQELGDFAALSLHNAWSIRFIEYMPAVKDRDWQRYFISGGEILTILREQYPIHDISAGDFAGPAKPYKINGSAGSLGIITPMSEHFCASCNRIRITADGQAKSCLFDKSTTDLKPFLTTPHNLFTTLHDVISGKPLRHHVLDRGCQLDNFAMSGIGG